MKILWLGINIGPQMLEIMNSKNGKLLSAYVSHNNIVEGLDALGVNMDSINSYHFSPRIIKEVIPEKWSRTGTTNDISVGYKNVKYLNRLLSKKALCRETRKWAKMHVNEDVTVVIYEMHSPFMAAAAEVKKIIPTAKICLIVPDLPQYMDMAMSPVKKVLKKLDWITIKRLMNRIDKYVLYAKPMADFLKLKDGQWVVMEGSYNSELTVQEDKIEKNDKISVMYSGVLDMRYGIPELLDSMNLLDDSYELWLTGNGNAVPLIKERATKDSRIKFYGYLPSRQDLINKQASATMLISPRRDTEEGSKYCFPSKLFEYMVSGNPVISCLLAGIPEEYHKHLVELKTITAECIAETIQNVAKMTQEERNTLGEDAKKFVLDNKNKIAQANNILEFLRNE